MTRAVNKYKCHFSYCIIIYLCPYKGRKQAAPRLALFLSLKRLTKMTMNKRQTEYIALYLFVFGAILLFGVLVRKFVLVKGYDEFSAAVGFFAR